MGKIYKNIESIFLQLNNDFSLPRKYTTVCKSLENLKCELITILKNCFKFLFFNQKSIFSKISNLTSFLSDETLVWRMKANGKLISDIFPLSSSKRGMYRVISRCDNYPLKSRPSRSE